MDLFLVMYRTLFFYFFVLLCYRLMGKREIGQLGVMDLIVSILIAELMAISIENRKDPIILTVIPISLLVMLELLLAFISIKSRKFRNVFDGKPSLIISNGKIDYKNMISQRYTLDDLLLELRQSGIKSIEEVEYAVLELNGKLSIFKYNFLKTKSSYPIPLIIDGKIQDKTLVYIRKDKNWLYDYLNRNNIKIENVFYAFLKNNKVFLITNKDFVEN